MNPEYAFPSDVKLEGEDNWTTTGGMTLRDYFATHAMNAIGISRDMRNNTTECGYIAAHAYLMADAMMKARTK